ncbi:hypothetical protein JOE31_002740 [Arthrobacter sp. PvP023]|nr:hypothetical protein [Arthrobacter sp. PvP023]
MGRFLVRSSFARLEQETKRNYATDYCVFFDFLWRRDEDWDEAGPDDLWDFEDWRTRSLSNPRRVGGARWNRGLAALGRLYSWAVKQGYVSVSPIEAREVARPGRTPGLSDAERLCLVVAQQLLGYSSETRWIRYAGTHLTGMFPGIPQQSGYNKRIRAAGTLISATITALAKDTPSWHDVLRLVDSTPLPCGMSRETVKRSDLAAHAGYGYCASHSRFFWGFRLYLISTPEGMPQLRSCASNSMRQPG